MNVARIASRRHARAVWTRRLGGILVVLCMAASTARAGESSPEQTVAVLHHALIEAMRNATTLGFEGRVKVLSPVVATSFDFSTITRVVLGKHWRDLSLTERAAMRETLERLSVATYAARFNEFEGERFTTLETATKAKERVRVRTELDTGGSSTVSLDYLLHEKPEGEWRIINVWADGVSEISLKRADYSKVLDRDGFGVLLDTIEEQLADLRHEASG